MRLSIPLAKEFSQDLHKKSQISSSICLHMNQLKKRKKKNLLSHKIFHVKRNGKKKKLKANMTSHLDKNSLAG